MGDRAKVLLIGGTSHVGKSTLTMQLAERLGSKYLSTDQLARHPGRPWSGGQASSGQTTVPADVVSHYSTLSNAELVDSVLQHYRHNVWPIAEAIVRSHVANPFDPSLVLEGSAILPDLVAASRFEGVKSIWLTATEELITARIRKSSNYDQRSGDEKQRIDAFIGRSLTFNEMTIGWVLQFDQVSLDVTWPDALRRLTALAETR